MHFSNWISQPTWASLLTEITLVSKQSKAKQIVFVSFDFFSSNWPLSRAFRQRKYDSPWEMGIWTCGGSWRKGFHSVFDRCSFSFSFSLISSFSSMLYCWDTYWKQQLVFIFWKIRIPFQIHIKQNQNKLGMFCRCDFIEFKTTKTFTQYDNEEY